MTVRALDNWINWAPPVSGFSRLSLCDKVAEICASVHGLTCIKAHVQPADEADDVAPAQLAIDQLSPADTGGFGFHRTIGYGAFKTNTLSGAKPRSKT
ncbi:hypothetical protein [Falsiruegeria litorea]|uniref:hypothetical protein n=1 Tax=Falsiruegeria litorea TaxID=1280831 RepID=UPI001055A76C|nr:hypothetical protein [Falsiruegeria litorea]